MSGESFPTADFREMTRTMRLLGSAETSLSAVEGDLRPPDANPTGSRK